MTLDPTLGALYTPTSPTIGKIAEALNKAQSGMEHAAKTHSNPQTRSKYADLTGILDVTREPFAKNGLSVVQSPYHLPGEPPSIVLVTTLMHTSGEWLRSVTPVNPRAKVKDGGGRVQLVDDMQTIGSAITYARRYALAAMVGVGQEDDDGNHASGRVDKPASKPAPRQAPKPAAKKPATIDVDAAARLEAALKERGQAKTIAFAKLITGRDEIEALTDLTTKEAATVYHEAGERDEAAA